jgi:hypothetical protein
MSEPHAEQCSHPFSAMIMTYEKMLLVTSFNKQLFSDKSYSFKILVRHNPAQRPTARNFSENRYHFKM